MMKGLVVFMKDQKHNGLKMKRRAVSSFSVLRKIAQRKKLSKN